MKDIDYEKVNTEMNKIYYLCNVLNTCKDRLELELGGKYTHRFKHELNNAQKWLRKVVNNAEILYKENADAYEDNTELLDEILDLSMNLNTEEKQQQALASLKLIIK